MIKQLIIGTGWFFFQYLTALAAMDSAAALDRCNVVWDSPSKNSSGSMPIGNGDIGMNAWVEENGDLLLLISKTDAWDENSRILKVGRVRIALSPSPFVQGTALPAGVEAARGDDRDYRRSRGRGHRGRGCGWMPTARSSASSATGPSRMTSRARLEVWRTEKRLFDAKEWPVAGT